MAKQRLFLHPVSIDLAWNEPEANLRQVERAIKMRLAKYRSISPREQLFLFPELTLTGFVTKNPPAYRVSPPDSAVAALRELAARYETAIAVGLPERNPASPSKPFNTLLLIGPEGDVLARYHKMHLFTWGANPESKVYSRGDAPCVVAYRGWKLGLAVCFDIRFSALFHAYARKRVEAILVASCWIGGPHKSYQYKTLNSAHAILSQAYVCTVNRGGRDPFFEYDGSAYVFSPFGENLFHGAPVELDAGELDNCRKLVVRPSDRVIG